LAIVDVLAKQTRQGAFDVPQRKALAAASREGLERLIASDATDAMLLAAMWGDQAGQQQAAAIFADAKRDTAQRITALQTLIFADSPHLLPSLRGVLLGSDAAPLQAAVIDQLGSVRSPEVATLLLQRYPELSAEIQPKVIELLTQRAAWTEELLQQIVAEKLPSESLNLNQLRRVASLQDEAVQQLVKDIYGTVRTDQRSDRSEAIARLREQFAQSPGDPFAGQAAFKKVCGQCHQMYGEGAAVGPDITRNGRNDWNQLLHNVLDPSAIIGPGYQSRTVVTVDGRVLTGLAVEESEQRVVLKVQGGNQETILRDDIETYKINQVSMMPEELEKQLTPEELADLFAYLALDKPPSDPTAKRLPGAPAEK